jgi:putative tricarboxylic transport membrane protein
MRAVDLATASIFVLLGGIVVFDSIRIGIGWGTDGPRSGFFPFWLGVILILASVTIAVQAWRRAADQPFVTREQLVPVLKVLWPATVMVILITPLGLYVASTLYLALLTFVVFELWFLVPMPKGPLEAWLGY